jgi:hypothetical protein
MPFLLSPLPSGITKNMRVESKQMAAKLSTTANPWSQREAKGAKVMEDSTELSVANGQPVPTARAGWQRKTW